jgi:hypothetical protein
LQLADIIQAKRQHLGRLANTKGAAGEVAAIDAHTQWIRRPKGKALKTLMTALQEQGVSIKASSFDAIALPSTIELDFNDLPSIRAALPDMVFVEIKTASQTRVKDDFSGFFFAVTENEIAASQALGERHRVLLYNRATGGHFLTSVPDVIARAKSTTWQVSVQL